MSRYIVDWDGTCVNEMQPWIPGQSGDWLPGAVEGLRWLSERGRVWIFSLRCHLYELDDCTPRVRADVVAEVADIRRRLDEVGLLAVQIYPPDRGKPPGDFYIDDRGIRFYGWASTKHQIKTLEAVS